MFVHFQYNFQDYFSLNKVFDAAQMANELNVIGTAKPKTIAITKLYLKLRRRN